MDSERRQANQRTAARPKRKWRRSHEYVNAHQRVRPVGWSWLSSSADVAPGNSGSPVRSGRLVGVAALSNSNVHTIAYQEDTSGNHAVSGAGIVALLETVYDAGNLVKEIGAKPALQCNDHLQGIGAVARNGVGLQGIFFVTHAAHWAGAMHASWSLLLSIFCGFERKFRI